MNLTLVWQPLKIGSVEIKNRVARTANATSFSPAGMNDDWIGYHRARARGGVGLSILEAGAVHPNSQVSFLIDDAAMPAYERLMKDVRPYGMRVFQQLHHAGHQIGGKAGQMPWSPSAVPSPVSGIVGVPMRQAEIDELVAAFAAAARRCRDAGLDGVEIHGGHGYIFSQFLSPLTNQREDRYNGTLLDRARFLMEVLQAIRAEVGADFPLGVRLGASAAKGGLSVQDVVTVSAHLEAERLIDYLDVTYSDSFLVSAICASMAFPSGYELGPNKVILETVRLPRIVTGRFRTLEECEGVLRDGQADLVSMVRAHIAEPDIVRKTQNGRIDDIRPCIACNQGCHAGLVVGGRMQCAINPAAGNEQTLDEELIVATSSPKKVMIIGAGPGGLEAARIAAKCGHKVILAEASMQLGGTLQIARRAPYLHILGDLLHWYEGQLSSLGVDVRFGLYAEASEIVAEKPDVVIVATGSVDAGNGIQARIPGEPPGGMDLPHVHDPAGAITECGGSLAGKHAVIFDDFGRYNAVAVADHLVKLGASLTFVTSHASFAPRMLGTFRDDEALIRLGAAGFSLLVNQQLTGVEPGFVSIRQASTQNEARLQADLVVVVTTPRPVRSLFDDLVGQVPALHLIGDALSPRDLMAAIHDGHRCARFL